MRAIVRIRLEDGSTVYPAAAPMQTYLTPSAYKARKYHNELNATLDAEKWGSTLRTLGVRCQAELVRMV